MTPQWLDELEAFSAREAKVYAALPCKGDQSLVSRCSDAFAATCPERRSKGCPREICARSASRERIATGDPAAWLVSAGVPREIAGQAIAMDRGEIAGPAYQAVRASLSATRQPMLLAHGDPTAWAPAAAWWLLQHGGGRFVEAWRMEGWKFDDVALAAIERVQVLVLHDLGGEFVDGPSPAESRMVAILERTLSMRVANGRETVVTTSLKRMVDLQSRYGASFAQMLAKRSERISISSGG